MCSHASHQWYNRGAKACLGKMDQWLMALVALAEGTGSVPSTHIMVHKGLEPQFQGI